MELPEPNFTTTPYGDVDAAALETLRAEFDTASLLTLVDNLDRLLPRLKAIQHGVRDDLLRLHRMANTLVYGAALTESTNGADIWEAAQALADEFRDLAETLLDGADVLQPLVDLQPDQSE